MNSSRLLWERPCPKVTSNHVPVPDQELKIAGVEALAPSGSLFYAFYDPHNLVVSLRQSLDLLHSFILADRPYDGLMGFSGGAVLAALYLAEQSSLGCDPNQVAPSNAVSSCRAPLSKEAKILTQSGL